MSQNPATTVYFQKTEHACAKQVYRKSLIILSMFLFTIFYSFAPLSAEDNVLPKNEIFQSLLKEGKQDEAYAFLMEWQNENADDPELFLSLFIYYSKRNAKEFFLQPHESAEDSSMVLTRPGEQNGSGNPTGRIIYRIDDVRAGLVHLEKGLKKYPDRLDMHLEKIRALGRIRDLARQRQAILDVLSLSKKNKNAWQWTGGTELDHPKDFMLESIQGFTAELIRLMRFDYARKISEEMIRLYPDVPYSYNNLAVIAYREGNDSRAIELFRKAEKINPKDNLVINNIARMYDHMNNSKQALVYYKKLALSNDADLREYAEERILALTPKIPEKDKAAATQSADTSPESKRSTPQRSSSKSHKKRDRS